MKLKFFSNGRALCTGLCLLALIMCQAHAQTVTPEAPSADKASSAEINTSPNHSASAAAALIPATASGNVPSDIVLLLDNSGSMKTNDPQFLTARAVTEFIKQLDSDTRLAIVIFDQKVTLAYPLTTVSEESRAEMLSSLKQINYKGLRTNSPDGLERAIYELKLHARKDAEQFIVFLTDGIVDTGNKQKDITKADWMRQELAADAGNNGIKIFGIAFTNSADFQLIQSLAQQTDAEYFRAFTADKIASVFGQIQEKISSVRQAALAAEIEASKPPPAAVEPPAPIMVQVPTQARDDGTTRHMLFGIAGLLVLVIIIVLLRGRFSGPTADTSKPGTKIPDAQLVDMRNVTSQKFYPLSAPITQIGRTKGREVAGVAYVVIPEKGISRHHAVIEFRSHSFWVVDQDSGNGTRLNNQLLTEEHRLKHGDILTFDNVNFMFYESGMEQADDTIIQASETDALGGDATLVSPGEPTAPTVLPNTDTAAQEAVKNSGDLNDAIDDISNWDFEKDK